MELDEKYFKLLNLLIYDKRSKMNGMVSGILLNRQFGYTGIYYQVFWNRIYANTSLFIEDIEKGNVVFTIPFAKEDRDEESFKAMAKIHEKRIKEFFGDKFREDMIMRISEEDRQEEIRKWDLLGRGLDNWTDKCYCEK